MNPSVPGFQYAICVVSLSQTAFEPHSANTASTVVSLVACGSRGGATARAGAGGGALGSGFGTAQTTSAPSTNPSDTHDGTLDIVAGDGGWDRISGSSWSMVECRRQARTKAATAMATVSV